MKEPDLCCFEAKKNDVASLVKSCMENSSRKRVFSMNFDQAYDVIFIALRSRVRIEVRPTENDSTRLYKNGGISVVITCS